MSTNETQEKQTIIGEQQGNNNNNNGNGNGKKVKRVVRKVVKKKTTVPLKGDPSESNPTPPQSEKSKHVDDEKKEAERRKKAEAIARARVEVEKKTFNTQGMLIEGECSIERLIEYASLFQAQHYDDIVEERSLAFKCGYPICPNDLPQQKLPSKQRYQINVLEHKVYDLKKLNQFCSERCNVASSFYQSQLSDVPVYLRDLDFEKQKAIDHFSTLISSLEIHTKPATEVKIVSASNSPDSLDILNLKIIEHPPITEILPTHFDFSHSQSSSYDASNKIKLIKKSLENHSVKPSSLNPTPIIEPQITTQTNTPKISNETTHQEKIEKVSLPSTSNNTNNTNEINHTKESETNHQTNTPKDKNAVQNVNNPTSPSILKNPEKSKEKSKSTMSHFGAIWSSLDSWCTQKTLDFLFGSLERVLDDESVLTSHIPIESRKQVLTQNLIYYIPRVYKDLGLSIRIEKDLLDLVSTFHLTQPVFSFTQSQWLTFLVIFLEILSFNNEVLKAELLSKKDRLISLRKEYGIREDEFKVFVEVFSNERYKI